MMRTFLPSCTLFSGVIVNGTIWPWRSTVKCNGAPVELWMVFTI